MKPKYVFVANGELNNLHKVTRFKLHLKRLIAKGATTDNEAYCGYYPIGGNNGQLKINLKDVDCQKCLNLYKHLTSGKKA